MTSERSGGHVALPAGTVTFLLADVEGSTRLWERQPDVMREAIARMDAVVTDAVALHGGVRPVEQGEGDSFVVAFARAFDAVAAALDLQQAPLAPIRLRIGLHTGDAQLRDEGNYIGAEVNRAARLRDLAHGGQTVMSQATHDLVVEHPSEGTWLVDLGTHRLRDLTRPERVHQLCHPDLPIEFPPLRSLDAFRHNLPVQLTSFVGREAALSDLRELLGEARLVTLTGSGGCGKTRLALQVAARMLAEHPDGTWQVELGPTADPALVPTAVAKAMGLNDESTRSTTETIVRHLQGRQVLLLLDNCEHLISACAALTETLLRSCSSLTVLATSREPLGVAGEAAFRVPSLCLPDDAGPARVAGLAVPEAVQLFADRARRARPGFEVNDANSAAVGEICRRLDGIPLAIELAAARIRVLSPQQIAAGLADRFRLLTGGVRSAVPRQQTLKASVDWSHALLTEPERVLFRRLAAFAGSFDYAAAEAVGAGDGVSAHQVLDQLTLLVDKSLVVARDAERDVRYRLLETVRHYAMEQLADSGEADEVRRHHRDHFLAFAEETASGAIGPEHEQGVDRLESELDNLRVAFEWSRASGDPEGALRLALALVYVWRGRGRWLEGRAWIDAALAEADGISPALRVEALGVSAWIEGNAIGPNAEALADEVVARAREIGEPRLLARSLHFASYAFVWRSPESATRLCREAAELAHGTGDEWVLADAQAFQGITAAMLGDLAAARALFEEGYAVARRAGHGSRARQCMANLGQVMVLQGEPAQGWSWTNESALESQAVGDRQGHALGLAMGAWAKTMMGDSEAAIGMAAEGVAVIRDVGQPLIDGVASHSLGFALLGAGEPSLAREEISRGWDAMGRAPGFPDQLLGPWAEADLAAGDVDAARRRAEETVARATAWKGRPALAWGLIAGARVALAEGEPERAEDLAHRALATEQEIGMRISIPDTLEVLAVLAAEQGDHEKAARLHGGADSQRQAMASARYVTYRDWHRSALVALRQAMSDEAFERAWAEGEALSLEELVGYASRGRGERKRPSTGWDSLTPAERDVARLVAEGLANKEIAGRLFVSPRTVQAHLTHIYTKLDLASRVQLAREADRRL